MPTGKLQFTQEELERVVPPKKRKITLDELRKFFRRKRFRKLKPEHRQELIEDFQNPSNSVMEYGLGLGMSVLYIIRESSEEKNHGNR